MKLICTWLESRSLGYSSGSGVPVYRRSSLTLVVSGRGGGTGFSGIREAPVPDGPSSKGLGVHP